MSINECSTDLSYTSSRQHLLYACIEAVREHYANIGKFNTEQIKAMTSLLYSVSVEDYRIFNNKIKEFTPSKWDVGTILMGKTNKHRVFKIVEVEWDKYITENLYEEVDYLSHWSFDSAHEFLQPRPILVKAND